MSTYFRRLGFLIRHLPFTLSILIALVVVELATNPGFGAMSATWINHLGYAPRDFFALRWHRLFVSLLVTDNRRSFAQAVLTVAFVGGALEWTTGTRKAAMIFWGTHLAGVLAETLFFAAPLYYLGSSFGEKVFTLRDVGASAAYFGCTGAVCALLPNPWRRICTALVFGFILANFVLPTPVGYDTPIRWMANLAHTVSFPTGFFACWRRGSAPAEALIDKRRDSVA
jgi:hypothetical protein